MTETNCGIMGPGYIAHDFARDLRLLSLPQPITSVAEQTFTQFINNCYVTAIGDCNLSLPSVGLLKKVVLLGLNIVLLRRRKQARRLISNSFDRGNLSRPHFLLVFPDNSKTGSFRKD